ncbi:helix-turn-helix domain-containing protein [Rhizosphaericola mali]|uniref:Helix-turn-helix domain-containing protein n=1 Tax=Rhizosphaericola mali TaxID=2545455 RepID=A0A5P2G2Z2_9BACT|nr:helix-turn-helix domain-containing protein [Rhizosphaericola mali]QES88489.1 helix-turn-helix domain-containing protein [Rhizosphaericola mali]
MNNVNHSKKEFDINENTLVMMEAIRRILYDFQQKLLIEIRIALKEKKHPIEKEWIKSNEIKKMLGISHGTLQTLRNNGSIPFSKIGGVIFYSKEELNKILKQKEFQISK